MNTIIFFLAGVSIGLATDKLYQSLFVARKQADEAEKEETVGSSEDKVPEVEESAVKERADKQEKADLKEQATVRDTDVTGKAKEKQDNLSQLKGVGPKLAEALGKIGVNSFQQLSDSSVDSLLEQLKETGARFTRPSIESVVQRAREAVDENKNL